MAGQADNHQELVQAYGQAPEDRPPFLRFEATAIEDRHRTNQANDGRIHYRDVHIVHVMARGDTKCIVPHIVKGWKTDSKMRKVKKNFEFTVDVEVKDPDTGEIHYEPEKHTEERTVEEPQIQYFEDWPWFDKLKERLRDGQISQGYYDYCVKSYEAWKEKNDVPVTGLPLKEWTLITEAQKRSFISVGIVTVEELAEANEEALSMVAGGRDCKKKAEHYMNANKGSAAAAQLIGKLETQIENQQAEFQQQVSEYQAKVAELEELIKQNAAEKKTTKKKTAKEAA